MSEKKVKVILIKRDKKKSAQKERRDKEKTRVEKKIPVTEWRK